MKVPLRWLGEYVDLSGIEVPHLVERLTLAGLEVAGVRCLGVPVPAGLPVKAEDLGPVWDADKVVVARVVQVDRHPNADKLKLVTLDYAAAQPKVVVTAAPNIQAGRCRLQGHSRPGRHDLHRRPCHAAQIKELKPSKLRGVPSDAMVMSEFELGISEESDGVIILPEDEAPAPGTPAVNFLGDIVLEIDVLPNMARCLSLIGVAREVAALWGRTLRLPPAALGNRAIDPGTGSGLHRG